VSKDSFVSPGGLPSGDIVYWPCKWLPPNDLMTGEYEIHLVPAKSS